MADDSGDVQQALAVLDSYQRQIEAVSRQLQVLQSVLVETRRAREALEGLKGEPTDLLVPLGANTFVHAKAVSKARVVTGVGAGVAVERPLEEAVKRLAEREGEVDSELERLTKAAMQLQDEADELEAQLRAATEQP